MSTLFIREYQTVAALRHDSGGPTSAGAIPAEPGLADQTVTFTATHGESAAFNSNTKFIAVTSDGNFCYVIDANPTATTSNFRIAAGVILYLGVAPGMKISAVTAA